MAVPTMPDSASGVSMIRSSPKSFCRFSVTRNTPPSLPMSSPMMPTLGPRSMARRKPALIALPMVTFDMSVLPLEARGVSSELGALSFDQRVLLDVDVVKHRQWLWVRHCQAACANPSRELISLHLNSLEELPVGLEAGRQIGLEPGDRVAQLPDLDLRRDAILRRVVRRRVRTHPVGERLDQHRSLPTAGRVQRGLGHCIHGQDVVAVHPDTGEAEAAGPLVERDPGLSLDRLGDGPLVVLAEEDDRRVRGCRVDEGLVHVALGTSTVTEVGNDRCVPIGVAGAYGMVVLDAHRVAYGVQSLSTDDDGVEVEVVLVRVPPTMVDPSEHTQQVERVDPATPGNAVLAVGREGIVLRTKRASGADLCRFLTEQAGPQTELTLTLQRGGLGVEPANEPRGAIEPAQVIVRQISDVSRFFGMVDALPLRGEQLDELGPADDLGDWRNQRCDGNGNDRFRRRRDFFVAHRHSFFANAGSPPARLGP